MPVTNATDFQKRIADFSDIARRQPVTVTHRGRPFLVLLSAEDYQRLKQIEERSTKAMTLYELPAETVAAMMNANLSRLPD